MGQRTRSWWYLDYLMSWRFAGRPRGILSRVCTPRTFNYPHGKGIFNGPKCFELYTRISTFSTQFSFDPALVSPYQEKPFHHCFLRCFPCLFYHRPQSRTLLSIRYSFSAKRTETSIMMLYLLYWLSDTAQVVLGSALDQTCLHTHPYAVH